MTIRLYTFDEAREAAATSTPMMDLVVWTHSFLLATHENLGRSGLVCPFTRLACLHNTMRVANLSLTPAGGAQAQEVIGWALNELDRIPAPPRAQPFRVIMLGFPACGADEGVAMLQQASRKHRLSAMLRGRMLGFLHPASETGGLWNADFRPLRAPYPMIAVRHLVEQDAPFIARQHLQWAPYLLRYRFAGARRLFAARRMLRAAAAGRLATP